jgi:hypothetical protein
MLCYPSNVKFFFKLLMPFVTFDFIPPENSTKHIFEFDEDVQSFSSALEGIDYETSNLILNTGSLFIMLTLIFVEYIFYKLLVLINWCNKRKCKSLVRLQNYLCKTLFYSKFYALFLGGFIEFTMSSLLAVMNPP